MLGYLTSGDAADWMYGEQKNKNKVLAFIPEIGNAFYVIPQVILNDLRNNLSANINAAALLLPYATIKAVAARAKDSVQGHVVFELKNIGLPDSGNFTVTLAALDDHIAAVGAPKMYSLKGNRNVLRDSISYTLKAGLDSARVRYLLRIHNGYFSDTASGSIVYKPSKPRGMQVFPNPAGKQITIELDDREAKFPVAARILDDAGKTVKTLQLKIGRSMVDVADLSAGCYYLQIEHQPVLSISIIR